MCSDMGHLQAELRAAKCAKYYWILAGSSAIVYSYFFFLVEGVSSSSGCLGKATLFDCGTPFAFHITFVCYGAVQLITEVELCLSCTRYVSNQPHE